MKFGNEFWIILSREYISPNLFAVYLRLFGSTGYCAACNKVTKRNYLRLFGSSGYCAACNKVTRGTISGSSAQLATVPPAIR
jgi:hypothetical protein